MKIRLLATVMIAASAHGVSAQSSQLPRTPPEAKAEDRDAGQGPVRSGRRGRGDRVDEDGAFRRDEPARAGVVAEVGDTDGPFAIGDRVVSNGKHAEYVAVPKNLCAPIPAAVDDEAAAFTIIGAIASGDDQHEQTNAAASTTAATSAQNPANSGERPSTRKYTSTAGPTSR